VAADAVIGPTIEQLRTYCAPLAGNVAGAADFRLGLEKYNANMPLPAGYVLPLEQEVEHGNQQMTGLFEIIDKTVGIVVEFDATPDRRGQAPVMDYDTMEAAIFSSILNWSPVTCRVPNNQGFYFAGGEFLDLDRARLFYQWRFTLRYQITDADGFQPPAPEDLVSVELDIYRAPPWSMPPPPPEEPAAIAVINMQPQAPLTVGPNTLLLGVGFGNFAAPVVLGTGINPT
jgi:hypothetical protein